MLLNGTIDEVREQLRKAGIKGTGKKMPKKAAKCWADDLCEKTIKARKN